MDRQSNSYLGTSYSSKEILAFLEARDLPYQRYHENQLCRETARLIAKGNVVGWFNGRMEFGPRALGARSIFGDARSTKMQSLMNLKIKYRESFRPFAPVVLAEDVRDWFEVDGVNTAREDFSSPYMLFVGHVKESRRKANRAGIGNQYDLSRVNEMRSEIPAITHVDYSARIQTAHKDTNPRLHRLLGAVKATTGCPVLINTSFNVRGEPIVESPEDAYYCFMRTEMDYLVLEDCLLKKSEQPEFVEEQDWKKLFQLD